MIEKKQRFSVRRETEERMDGDAGGDEAREREKKEKKKRKERVQGIVSG